VEVCDRPLVLARHDAAFGEGLALAIDLGGSQIFACPAGLLGGSASSSARMRPFGRCAANECTADECPRPW